MAVKLEGQAQWLNFHHLHYFYTIAKEGSIARASAKLNVGQPTLSTQLKQLEEAIGRELFERRNKRLILTESGRIAFQYAEEVFRLGSEMVEVLHDRLSNKLSHVQIGALDSVPKTILLDLIKAAYEAGPCSVSVLEGRGDELFRELAAHQLDLIISNFPPAMGQTRLFAKSIRKLEVAVWGAPKFKNLRNGFPGSLNGQPFVLPTFHSKLRHDVDHFLKLNGIRPEIVAETQDTSLQKLLGTAGYGLLPLPEVAVEELEREKKLMRLGTLKGVTEEIWLVAAERKIENPVAAKVMRGFEL